MLGKSTLYSERFPETSAFSLGALKITHMQSAALTSLIGRKSVLFWVFFFPLTVDVNVLLWNSQLEKDE